MTVRWLFPLLAVPVVIGGLGRIVSAEQPVALRGRRRKRHLVGPIGPNECGEDRRPFRDLGAGTGRDPQAEEERSADRIHRLRAGRLVPAPEDVNLSAEDSGTAEAPILYRAYRGENP